MFHIRSLRLWLCAAIVLSSVFIWGRAPKTVNAEGSLFTVISTDDGVDAAGCDATHCSLREAIIAANVATEGAIIQFAIPNTDAGCTEGGVCTIALTSPLPDITQAGIVINGYSQPGASVNTLADQDNAALKIVVDGSALSADMLTIKADGCTVRGLVIGGTSNSAISILGSSNTIEGNFIGADVEGNGVLPNGTGITIGDGSSATLFQGNTIGGDTPPSAT